MNACGKSACEFTVSLCVCGKSASSTKNLTFEIVKCVVGLGCQGRSGEKTVGC